MMFLGCVKWFSLRRGYGFIFVQEKHEDVFVHISQLRKSGIGFLIPGKKVRFNIYEDRGRKAAENIKLC